MSKRGQEMATKKHIDDRDIFEKALDDIGNNPLPYGFGGAALVGALGGNRLARRMLTKSATRGDKIKAGTLGAIGGAAVGAQFGGGPLSYLLSSRERLAKDQKAWLVEQERRRKRSRK